MTRPVAVPFLLILLAAAFPASAAEDWPKWLGPRGDNISKEQISDNWPSDGPKQLWRIPIGEGHASPVAKAGRIYLFTLDGNEETLACGDAATGKGHWRQSYGIRNKPQYQGTRATPTIEEDRIYTLGESGDLVCRQLDDGKQVWRTNVLDATGSRLLQWGCASSPLIVGDRIFVQTGQGGPIAVAVNKTSGKVEWKSEARTQAGYASLVHADIKGKPQLFIFAGRNVGAIAPETGRTIWSDAHVTDYDVNATTPIYHDGRVLFTSEYSKGKAAMYEVTNKSWKKLWESRDLKSRFQPVILDNGYVYGNSSGKLTCIDWNTGKLMWQARDRTMDLKTGGSILRAGGDKLITMSERGKLSLIRATPKTYEVLGQVQLFDADQIWASPLLYDGKLYCKGRDELVCLDVSP
jgi:outer membrane protein assembly factor BamB